MGRGIRFIIRLPATYAECQRVIDAAVKAEQWHDIGRLAYTPPAKNRPGAYDRLWDSEVTRYEQRYRAVVVHSSAHDPRRLKRLERELAASKLELHQQAKALHNEVFFCLADAQAAAAKACAQRTVYHTLDVRTEPRPQYPRGRPKKDGSRSLKAMHYGLVASVREDQAVIERRRAQAGCFVLLTNVPNDGKGAYDATTTLSSYKEQPGIERNFGFLKDDAIVNAIFPKTPERIEVLGSILILALLIWRLIEHPMRAHLAATATTLPGWDNKPTQRPAGYMMMMKFKGIVVLRCNISMSPGVARGRCCQCPDFLRCYECMI